MTNAQILQKAQAIRATYDTIRFNAECQCGTVPSCCDKTVAEIAADIDRDETAKSLRKAMRRSR